jgi:hypothetical protein
MVVSQHDAIAAFLFMTLREGRLSLKYAYYDSCDIADIATALRAVIVDINPWLFVCADDALSTLLKRDFPFYFATQKKSTEIYATKGLSFSAGSHPQFGTGDAVFT